MEFKTAFSVALKIILSNLLFGVILVAIVFYGDILLAAVALVILAPITATIMVYFILQEAENMMAGHIIALSKQTQINEETKNKEEAIEYLYSNLDSVKYQPIINSLINSYRQKGFLRPERHLEEQVKEKIASGKTKEQAINELNNKFKTE